MKNKEYQKLLKNMIFGPIIKITEVKGHDYACDADTLSNFKVVGGRLGIKGSEVAWFFMQVKLARLENLKNKDPQCESVLDTVRDLINYIGLYYASKYEEKSS